MTWIVMWIGLSVLDAGWFTTCNYQEALDVYKCKKSIGYEVSIEKESGDCEPDDDTEFPESIGAYKDCDKPWAMQPCGPKAKYEDDCLPRR